MQKDSYIYDYYRMTGEKYRVGLKSLIRWFAAHNLQLAFWYRKYQKTNSMIARIALYRLSRKYGLEISPRAQIGKGMYLGHPYNITIGEEVVLGNNVNLHKGCTIG